MAESRRRRLRLRRPGRIAAVRALVVLGTILALVSVLAVWVDRLALETDTWVSTSDQLLADEDVREAVAATLTDTLYSSVDVPARLEAALPPAVRPLAGPAASGLREFTERRANILLTRPRVVAAWSEANRTAHEQFVRIVEGESVVVQTEGGNVVLLLRPLLGDLAGQVGLADVAARLPADAGTVVVMESDQLEAVQTLLRILDLVATWLWVIALACWALAVYLSPGRRLKTLRGVAFGLLFVGLVVLVVLRVGGNVVVDSLVEAPSNLPAVESVFDIVTGTLRTSAWTLTAIAVLMLVGTWLAGTGRRATAFRRWSAPALRDHPEVVWGVFALLVLLLLVWGPIRATRNLIGILLLVGLAAFGLWAFRRATLLEFPDAVAGEWSVRGAVGRLRGSGDGDRVGQLERLAALHKQGALTDEEFEVEKTAVLASRT